MRTGVQRTTFRLLGRSDLPRLAELSSRLGAETSADWAERLGHHDAVVLGAEIEGTLVGYAAAEIRRAFGRSPRAAWVDAFGVDLAQRGHGVGRALATELLARLRERGAEHVSTLVPVHDRELGPFFRELGFRGEALQCIGRAL